MLQQAVLGLSRGLVQRNYIGLECVLLGYQMCRTRLDPKIAEN